MTVNGVSQIGARLRVPDGAERNNPVQPGSPAGVREDVEAPRGADPELWRILSREERERFSGAEAMGPLTYGYLINSGRADLPVVRGGQLDIKA